MIATCDTCDAVTECERIPLCGDCRRPYVTLCRSCLSHVADFALQIGMVGARQHKSPPDPQARIGG